MTSSQGATGSEHPDNKNQQRSLEQEGQTGPKDPRSESLEQQGPTTPGSQSSSQSTSESLEEEGPTTPERKRGAQPADDEGDADDADPEHF